MTQAEARAINLLLSYLLGPSAVSRRLPLLGLSAVTRRLPRWERLGPTSEQARAAAMVLAVKAHHSLDAGWRPEEIVAAWEHAKPRGFKRASIQEGHTAGPEIPEPTSDMPDTAFDDICGFCGLPEADKIPHPIRWPDERNPGTQLVHAACEEAECSRASSLITGKRRDDFLRNL